MTEPNPIAGLFKITPGLQADLKEKPKLAEALAAFQAEIPRVAKHAKADIRGSEGKASYSYDYAELSDLTEACMPLLGKLGLAFTSKPTWVLLGDGPSFVLLYKLMHTSGEQEVGIWPLPPPERASMQNLGSAISYARRYAFQAVTGVAPGGEDDDAQSAGDGPLPETVPQEPSPREVARDALGHIDSVQKRRITNRLQEMGVPDDAETRMAWVSGIRDEYTENLDALSSAEAVLLLESLRPAGKQQRNTVIAAMAEEAGVSEREDVLRTLSEWTGREIKATADLAVYEAASAMKRMGRMKAERVAQDEAAETPAAES